MIHGLKGNRGLNSAAIVASQSMKATDFAADVAQNYKMLFVSPVGVTTEYFGHPCWEPVERFFHEVQFEERYGGLMYISSGTG